MESNRIERIYRPPFKYEVKAHDVLWRKPYLKVTDVERFVWVVAKVPIRHLFGQNVTVNGHRAPIGGPQIVDELKKLLHRVSLDSRFDPHEAHCQYEALHPFLDGNGRSGRAVWAWHMRKHGLDPFLRPFLQEFYYQSLSAYRR